MEEFHREGSFSIGGVGFAGRPAALEVRTREILGQGDAEAVLLSVLNDGASSKAGQLYALWGLHQMKYPGLEAVAQPLLASKEDVGTMSGCLMRSQKVAEIAKQIIQKEY
eukprot:TRINITY_DN1348_c0_g1_i1.p2 TRINITY_DN1348_c0_g1~~TRINITY_DN1348_c0_g1_i1.p2  ORF type:complete len:110 (+),score=14.83 TRINITY_DN1348_c0_g1_i1:96-425(+)